MSEIGAALDCRLTVTYIRDFLNKFNTKLNEFRNKQYSEIIEKNKDDPKTLFRVINHSLHRKQSSPMPSGLSNNLLAEKFSEFFAEKIDKIRQGIEDNQNEQYVNPESPEFSGVKFDEFRLLTEKEIEKIINYFPNKQCGLDPLPMSLLKNVCR